MTAEPNNDSPLNSYAAALWNDQEGAFENLKLMEVHIFSCSFYTKVRREMLICKSWIAEYKKVMRKQYRDAGGALPC